MGDKTAIEWTDATWNPIRGCSRVSEGCLHCYAEGVARRFSGPGLAYEGLVRIGGDGKPHEWNGQIKFVEDHLLDPLKWKTPRKVFVNSMSDLFHENVTDEMRDRIFAVMALCPQHTFQVLTKRPERMREYLTDLDETYPRCMAVSDAFADWSDMPKEFETVLARAEEQRRERDADSDHYIRLHWPLPNVWLGVSVENQKAADERIRLLLQTPAAVRYLSMEPLLGPVTFRWAVWDKHEPHPRRAKQFQDVERGGRLQAGCVDHLDGLRMLDWVIVGGESGHGARPMHPDWVRSLRDQCAAAGVPFFFKQWGEWIPWEPEQAPCWVSQHGKCEDHHALFPENIADNPRGWDCGLGFEPESHAAFQRVGKKAAGHLLDGVEHHSFPEVQL